MTLLPYIRFHDWPERLLEYVASREQTRFAWGKGAHDCCSFANGGVVAQTGVDLMADIPDYASADEADLILAAGLAQLVDERLERRRSVGLARRGDLVLADLRGVETLCLVEGDKIVGPGTRGLQRVPLKLAQIAWAV